MAVYHRLALSPPKTTGLSPMPAVLFIRHLAGYKHRASNRAIILLHLSLYSLMSTMETKVPKTSSITRHVFYAQMERPQRYAFSMEFLRIGVVRPSPRRMVLVPHPQCLNGVLVEVPTTLELAAPRGWITITS